MSAPYLAGTLRRAFDAWLDDAVRRHSASLEFREIRRGAQALSSLYVHKRKAARGATRGAALGRRASEGRGKRAALATYYAPLHFLAVHHGLRLCEGSGAFAASARVRSILDAGCGTGATGGALARSLEGSIAVRALDRSGWALDEARRTLSALGVSGRTVLGRLPPPRRPPGRGELVALGWVVNELSDAERGALLDWLREACERGAGLLVFEPLSHRAAPWWDEWVAALGPSGASAETLRVELARPGWIEQLDRATGLDHRVIGARVLARAPERR